MAWNITRVESRPEQGEQWRSAPAEPSRSDGRLRINPDRKYQTMVGFGGAFTEATASYFDGERGLGYSIGRIPIHSCDFSLGNYAYMSEDDESLQSFTLAHEEQWLFPLIRDAEEVRGGKIPRYDVSPSVQTASQPTRVQGTLAPHAIATLVWEPTKQEPHHARK